MNNSVFTWATMFCQVTKVNKNIFNVISVFTGFLGVICYRSRVSHFFSRDLCYGVSLIEHA
jgi:hypothetical protein